MATIAFGLVTAVALYLIFYLGNLGVNALHPFGMSTSNENSIYLEVTVHGDPADPRVDDITGDIGVGTNVLANWGLHLIDVNLAMGNLVDIVGQQAKAYKAKK